MIIQCTNCQARYQYDEERFERKPAKKIRCAKCQTVFEVRNPAFVEAPPVAPAGKLESTLRGKPPAPPPPDPLSMHTSESPLTGEAGGDEEGQMPADVRVSLAIIDGPDEGTVFRIEKPRIVIGRSSADLVLNDTEASRNHAAIVVSHETIRLEDLQSTNGTYVGGQKIDEPVILQNQAEFVIGGSTIMLIVTKDGLSPA